ncbi:hypothetical protein XELAEV_18028872mg [Xenopus laevis]|uniref:Uncharacterized protein n=1 Tax=Xenopus laevis TaxID=8355 RepID=A0A974HHL2_XENLA|nr:hypothetical protein XELAEV_18028872mg [Xenopus laevis]
MQQCVYGWRTAALRQLTDSQLQAEEKAPVFIGAGTRLTGRIDGGSLCWCCSFPLPYPQTISAEIKIQITVITLPCGV